MPFLPLIAAVGLVFAGAAMGAPLAPDHLEVRVFDTDRETASFLRTAVEAPDQDAGKLAARLDELVGRRKLTERAHFTKKIENDGAGGDRFTRKQVTGNLVVDPELTVELGVQLEVEANLGPHGLTSLRLALEVNTPVKGKRYHLQRTNFGIEIPDRRWVLAASFADEETETFALLRTARAPSPAEANPPLIREPIRYVRLGFAFFETNPRDLQTVMENSKGREETALEWLRKRATLKRRHSLAFRPGQQASIEDQLPYVRDDGDGPFMYQPGFTITMAPYLGPAGRLVDLELLSDLRHEANRGDDPDFAFLGARTLVTEVPAFFPGAPSAKDGDEAWLLVVTARVETLMDGKDEYAAMARDRANPDDIYSKWYPLHPALPRLLAPRGPVPNPKPFAPIPLNLAPRPQLREVLGRHGMTFPEGTSAHVAGSGGKAYLRHTRKGHEAFEALVKEFTPDGP